METLTTSFEPASDADVVRLPVFAELDPHRTVEIGHVDGLLRAIVTDVATGWQRVIADGAGVDLAEIEPDGRHVWWFAADDRGVGRWLRQPFAGGPIQPALSGVAVGRMYGVAFHGDTAAVAVGVDGASRVFVGAPGGPARRVLTMPGYLSLIDMAPGGRLLALAGRPDGNTAVCLCAPETRERLVFLAGARNRRLWPLEFRPAGEPELLLAVERDDGYRLATWRADTGVTEYDRLGFDTEITARWYDAETVLVQQDRAGRSTLFVVSPRHETARTIATPPGTILDVSCAPSGEVRYLWSRSDIPPRVLACDPRQPDHPAGEPPARSSVRHSEVRTGEVHSLLATPPGDGPWPTIFLVHGGPFTHDRDCFDPRVAPFTAAGFAVVRTNYRGSTGYGSDWRHGFGNRVGLAQVEDLDAVRRHLVDLGVAAAGATGLCGYSWGGYLALLAMGLQSESWTAALAAYPVADYLAAHHATTPALREVDEELFGGGPAEVPQRYHAASPMSYVDKVRGPLLLVASPTDEKCPPDQLKRYAEVLHCNGIRHELAWVGGGHHSRDLGDHVDVLRLMVRFAVDVMGPTGLR